MWQGGGSFLVSCVSGISSPSRFPTRGQGCALEVESEAAHILGSLVQARDKKQVEGIGHKPETRVVYMAGHAARMSVGVGGGVRGLLEDHCKVWEKAAAKRSILSKLSRIKDYQCQSLA